MKPRDDVHRGQKAKSFKGQGLNWILIAGSALLSTLSIRLAYRLKQTLDSKQQANARDGNKGIPAMQHPPNDRVLSGSYGALPLVMVPAPVYTREKGIMWVSSPDPLELPQKSFHHSNCSNSPCVSELGSDIFRKREVIQKLRQQLKSRDDMIMEMQVQIMELRNSLNSQLGLSMNMQSQFDAAKWKLINSKREIQRLRKAISGHSATLVASNNKSSTISIWPSEAENGHSFHSADGRSNFEWSKKRRGNGEKIAVLKREVGQLKNAMDGKEYLLQSYKEQKAELSVKIKEMQQRLDSQLPNFL